MPSSAARSASRIAEHQAIAFQLAEMATKVEAAHLMMVNAARAEGLRRAQRTSPPGWRSTWRVSSARRSPSRASASTADTDTPREYEIERLMRDAPFLLIGEGTSEIQKNIISKRLLADYRI
jgi:alkylation response protein AidB-like acyl-CoA dehydrogenase